MFKFYCLTWKFPILLLVFLFICLKKIYIRPPAAILDENKYDELIRIAISLIVLTINLEISNTIARLPFYLSKKNLY